MPSSCQFVSILSNPAVCDAVMSMQLLCVQFADIGLNLLTFDYTFDALSRLFDRSFIQHLYIGAIASLLCADMQMARPITYGKLMLEG